MVCADNCRGSFWSFDDGGERSLVASPPPIRAGRSRRGEISANRHPRARGDGWIFREEARTAESHLEECICWISFWIHWTSTVLCLYASLVPMGAAISCLFYGGDELMDGHFCRLGCYYRLSTDNHGLTFKITQKVDVVFMLCWAITVCLLVLLHAEVTKVPMGCIMASFRSYKWLCCLSLCRPPAIRVTGRCQAAKRLHV